MRDLNVCIDYNNFNPVMSSDGTSDEAQQIRDLGMSAFRSFYEASTLSKNIEVSNHILGEISEECQDEDWDGYGALPVKREALIEAMKLIRMLPAVIPLPRINPEPSGGITLRWKRGLHHSLILAVKGCKKINYAAISGPEKYHGQLFFTDSMPKKIPELLVENRVANVRSGR